MDTRTRQHLIDQGHISHDGLTHRPTHRHCQSGCGLLLLAAINDTGQNTWLDPWPITPASELHALLTGRSTYTVCERELVPRDAWRISHINADQEKTYATHQCGTPPFPANPKWPPATKNTTDHSQPPPF